MGNVIEVKDLCKSSGNWKKYANKPNGFHSPLKNFILLIGHTLPKPRHPKNID